MIVDISEKKMLWFGYELNNTKTITFEEGIKMLMESHGYEWQMVVEQFDVVGGDTMAARIGRYNNNPTTESEFFNRSRHYLEAFTASNGNKWKHPNSVSILTVEKLPENIKGRGRSISMTLFKYMATK